MGVKEKWHESLRAGFEPAIPGGPVFKTGALPGYATSAYERSVYADEFLNDVQEDPSKVSYLGKIFLKLLCQPEL